MFHNPSMLGRLWMGGSLVCLAAADGLALPAAAGSGADDCEKGSVQIFFFFVGTEFELSPPAVPSLDRLPSPPHPQMLLPVGRRWVVVRRLRSTQIAPVGIITTLSGRGRPRTVNLLNRRQLKIICQSSGSYWHWLVLLT